VVSGGKVVNSSYRQPFADPAARQAERLLLGEVVRMLKDQPAVGLGKENLARKNYQAMPSRQECTNLRIDWQTGGSLSIS
jgi:hypothetical protein